MRHFDDLSEPEQKTAENQAATDILKAILEGGLRFNDAANSDDFQARIDAACAKADRMQTPWFAHEYIMDTCREEIEGMARAAAEDALYPNKDEQIIQL